MPSGPALTLVAINGGTVALTHRPKVAHLPAMRAMGVTHLVTLLSRREGALVVGSAAAAAGLEWIWVELPDGRQPLPSLQHRIVGALETLVLLLHGGASVVVHCSAGIHRTGMFAYALLRACDLEPDDAAAALARLRADTAEGVGEQRLTWAEELGAATRIRLAAQA